MVSRLATSPPHGRRASRSIPLTRAASRPRIRVRELPNLTLRLGRTQMGVARQRGLLHEPVGNPSSRRPYPGLVGDPPGEPEAGNDCVLVSAADTSPVTIGGRG
jgi:hypothetical protein